MIRIILERSGGTSSFDIDTNFRTAILGENGIGKTSILESIASGSSKRDWLSVHVPRGTQVSFLSQIEAISDPISGGEHTKRRLEKLFSEKADLYVLDEPTNNLDQNNIEWLKQRIVKNSLPTIFTSHNIDFIDNVAEVIFYLDSNGVEKTKEKCSSYLITRKKKIEKEFILYEANIKKQKELIDAAKQARQHSEAGSRWKGTDKDKFLRGFKRNAAGKSASTARILEERAEKMEVEKPEYDPIPRVSLNKTGYEGYMFSFITTSLSGKRISLTVKTGDKMLLTGPNGIGKTTFVKYIKSLLDKNPVRSGDTFNSTGKINFLYIEQDWYEKIENKSVREYLLDFGLGEQESYKSISYNYLDTKILNKKFKDISPGVRIKILLGALSLKSFDLIIWDEPTNHLDVMTQIILSDAFQKFEGALIVVSHDKVFLDNKVFTRIDF